MYLARFFSAFSILLCVTFLPAHSEEILQKKHASAAQQYVNLLDNNYFEDAWLSMSSLFKGLNDKQLWLKRVAAVRHVYGSPRTRQVRRASYRNSYRNSPDGNYVMVQYETAFANKSKGIETIVLHCEKNDDCSVVDYIIN